MIIRPVVAKFIHADGRTQTDKTKLIVAFRNDANTPKNCSSCPQKYLYDFYASHKTQRVLPYITLTFRHRASCILGQTIHYSPENAFYIQGGSNMTGTDLCVNKPHCAAAVRT